MGLVPTNCLFLQQVYEIIGERINIWLKNIKQIFDWSINKASSFNNIEKEFNWIRVNNNKVKRINTKQIR